MRRFVFILLLVILPVQFCWAPALGYCRHEAGSAAQPIGHHEHQHSVAPEDQPKDSKTASPANVDGDCGACQFSTAQTIVSSSQGVVAPVPGSPQFAYGMHCSQYIPSGPERPDRVALTAAAARFGGSVVSGVSLPADLLPA